MVDLLAPEVSRADQYPTFGPKGQGVNLLGCLWGIEKTIQVSFHLT